VRIRSLLLTVLMALLAACDSRAPAKPDKRLTVVCTTGMIADVARAIAGDRCAVTSLMGEGVDPHLYKATRADMAALTSADIVFYNGLLLEGKMTDALERVKSSGRRVTAVSDKLPHDQLLSPQEFQGHPDPHIWMDPSLWSRAAEHIRDQLIATDPEGEQAYRANSDAYLQKLSALQSYSAQTLTTVPQKVLVTAHDAFNYFGRAYGFEVVGIQGISTESEAGVRDIENLVDLLVSRKVPAVFVETTVSERNINALIAGCRARGHSVAIGGSLFSDAMGAPGTYEGTYIGMIDHNVTTIARALGGQAPERGMNSLLGKSALPANAPTSTPR
jgi:manganese/zinc/iron transport system substrate-binding protein